MIAPVYGALLTTVVHDTPPFVVRSTVYVANAFVLPSVIERLPGRQSVEFAVTVTVDGSVFTTIAGVAVITTAQPPAGIGRELYGDVELSAPSTESVKLVPPTTVKPPASADCGNVPVTVKPLPVPSIVPIVVPLGLRTVYVTPACVKPESVTVKLAVPGEAQRADGVTDTPVAEVIAAYENVVFVVDIVVVQTIATLFRASTR